MSVASFGVLSKVEPEKSLTIGLRRLSGRNHAGQMVVAHRGGGAKRCYRLIDFGCRDHFGEKARVETIEYDPNRTAFIAKLSYEDGEKSYILAPEGLEIGSTVTCADEAPPKPGNRMRIRNIPASTQIHSLELMPGRGGELARSAGSYATLSGFDGKYAIIRLPSGESRKVLADNFASIGVVSNTDHANVMVGKAGRKRWMGVRPTVRGKAKNPHDHPHGGGEGGSPIGMAYPKTPWGAPALGRRTRNKKKSSGKLILSRRKK